MYKLQEIESWNEAIEPYLKFIEQFLNFLKYFVQMEPNPLISE